MNTKPPLAQDCAIAFLDLLGFRALVLRAHSDAEAAAELFDLMQLLQRVILVSVFGLGVQ